MTTFSTGAANASANTLARPASLVAIALLLGALVGACSHKSTVGPPAGTATSPRPKESTVVIPDGSPRIVDSAAGGVHVQYRVYGRGEPLVVLIHGWSCDSNYWQAQVADLKTRYTVVTVDLAGHGASGANRDDWSMATFGADVAAVVDALPDHPRVVLVGHSMGGPVMVEAAKRLGARVVGVIGLDTLKAVGLPGPSAVESGQRMAAFEQDSIGSTRALVANSMFTPRSDPVLKRRIVDDMSQAPPQVALGALRGLNAWDAVAGLRALSVPVVVINSDLNGITDEARIRKLVPGFRVVTVAGLGHFLMMEDPARVNPILDAEIRALAR